MMRYIFISIFLFICGIAKPINVYLDGYIVHSNNSKERCSIKVPFNIHNQITYIKLMNSVSVRNSDGSVSRYKADELKEFAFGYEGKLFRFASFENNVSLDLPRQNTFMQIVEEGSITLYQVYHNGTLSNLFACGSIYYISKNSPHLIKLKKADELLNAVSDDMEVFRTLSLTKYENQNIPLIVKRYNNHNVKNGLLQYGQDFGLR